MRDTKVSDLTLIPFWDTMKDMIPAFMKIDNGEILPIGYQHVNFHMVFDIKTEYFYRKPGW